jgi:hypothetical protein
MTAEPIQLYVGTDPQQHVAEKALEASVRENTSGPVQIHWMRQGDPGWSWGGRKHGWATPFTFFRWSIPEKTGHKGRAIYMDADMIALGDLRELWEWDLAGNYVAATARPDVIVWDCERAPPLNWTPEDRMPHKMMSRRIRGCPQLPEVWDVRDSWRPDAKILHATQMAWQVWKPYRDRFKYDRPHPSPKACAVFWEYALKGHGFDVAQMGARDDAGWCTEGETRLLGLTVEDGSHGYQCAHFRGAACDCR